jgi:arabinofuranosyltransferase
VYGQQLRDKPQRVFVGGAFGGPAIGYVGFAAGPEKYFIDTVGLSDPLLSRLPVNLSSEEGDPSRPGHFYRSVPKGYVESLSRDENLIEDPDIHDYYSIVRTITRGPLFDSQRFRYIVEMNFGRYDHLLDPKLGGLGAMKRSADDTAN